MTTELLEQARAFTNQGFSVIPIKNKKPPKDFTWTDRRKKLATEQELVTWFSNGEADSAAITIDDTEFAIDTDGSCESLFSNKVIARLSPELAEAVFKTTHTKSPNGNHRLFKINAQEFPDGIKEKLYVKLDGHSEIALKGKGHYLTECGPGYEIVNDIGSLVRLRKEQVEELLNVLDAVKAETYGIKSIAGILLPYYTNGKRDNLVFALSGYLHKNGVSESFISEIVESLVYQKNDEEPQARLRVVKDTCSKDRNSDQVSGYGRLLEALDNNQNGIADIEKILNELEIGKFNIDRNSNQAYEAAKETDPTIDLDPHIKDMDYAEYIISNAKRTVKREDALIRQIVYVALSKDSDNPLNLAVLATASEGKTHAVVETLKPFEKLGLWVIGSMSPKVIIRQNGVLVNNNNELIEAIIVDLKTQIKECKKKNERDEAEVLERHLRELYDNAKILIDLSGKLFLFLERPDEDTWNIFKTTLSHDRWEIEHPYVYEVPGTGFKVKKVVLRGWPACIYCSAQNESRSSLWPEIQSRFLVTAPNMIPEKYQEGNMLIAQQMSLPKSIQKIIIRSDQEIELAVKCATYLSQQIKKLSSQDPNASVQPVFIPYGGILGVILKWDRGTDNRINKRVFSFLRMIALSRAHLRYKLHFGKEELVISDLAEDLHEVLHITQNFTGIPPDKLKEYKDVFLAAYRSKVGPDINKDGSKQEDVIAVTTNDCCKKHKEVTGISINAKAYKPRYIDEWINASIIEEQKSNIDNRQYIYFPLADLSDEDIEIAVQTETQKTESRTKCMSFMISNISGLSHRDNILQHSKIIIPKKPEAIPENWLELYILHLLQYPDANGTFEILDKNNQKICIYRFIEDYIGPNRNLSGYVSNAVFHNNDKEVSDELKNLEKFDRKRCKTLSLSCNLDIKDITSFTDDPQRDQSEANID